MVDSDTREFESWEDVYKIIEQQQCVCEGKRVCHFHSLSKAEVIAQLQEMLMSQAHHEATS